MLTGSRERNLLKLSESAIRGLSPPIADVTDDEETEEFNINSDVPEEDMLLPANPPECVLSLPFYLSPSLYSPESVRKDHSLLRRKTSKTVEAINLFCDFIFTRDMQTRMVLRAMSRDVDPLISGHYATVDSQLFLDYLPLMRCMAVHECSSEFIFNAAEAQDPDAAATMTNRLRSTRRSKKLGREHYLERVVPSFVWQQSDTTAKEVGERLADSSLLHER